jgi:hypothetical protein
MRGRAVRDASKVSATGLGGWEGAVPQSVQQPFHMASTQNGCTPPCPPRLAPAPRASAVLVVRRPPHVAARGPARVRNVPLTVVLKLKREPLAARVEHRARRLRRRVPARHVPRARHGVARRRVHAVLPDPGRARVGPLLPLRPLHRLRTRVARRRGFPRRRVARLGVRLPRHQRRSAASAAGARAPGAVRGAGRGWEGCSSARDCGEGGRGERATRRRAGRRGVESDQALHRGLLQLARSEELARRHPCASPARR